MKVRVLGCSGGIGDPAGEALRTTSLLIDDDILIDCGTGIGDLSFESLARIDHVFLTHSHFDHIACLPMLVDTVGELRSQPLTVHATEATLEIMRAHVFNWAVWPDFCEIPSPQAPYLQFQPIRVGATVAFGERQLTPLPVRHTVPAVGYHLASPRASLVFSGDTGPCAEFWAAVNRIENLRYLLVETAFPDAEHRLATISRHLCPSMLVGELAQFRRAAEIFVTHVKPIHARQTWDEIEAALGPGRARMLARNQVFDL